VSKTSKENASMVVVLKKDENMVWCKTPFAPHSALPKKISVPMDGK